MEKVNILIGATPVLNENFVQLKNEAGIKELIELTEYPNAVVRCYAFWALYDRNYKHLFPVLLAHINDEEVVKTQLGCVGSSKKVGDFFAGIATRDGQKDGLDTMQQAQLDSILIYTPNNLEAKAIAITNARPKEQLYPRIRELVTREHNGDALVTLAKYRKEQDTGLIAGNTTGSNTWYTYKAIAQIPHPAFFPLLDSSLHKIIHEEHDNSAWKELYMAIAAYKNEQAAALLKTVFTQALPANTQTYHMDYLFSAVHAFSCPAYEDLLWILWRDQNRITTDIFTYLYKQDSAKALTLAKASLLSGNSIRTDFNYDFYATDTSGSPEAYMLNLLLRTSRPAGIEIIRKNLSGRNISMFEFYAQKAAEVRDESFIDPLFARLYEGWHSTICPKAAETLIAYKNPDVNKRLAEAMKQFSYLEYFEGGKDLKKLLKKHHIK